MKKFERETPAGFGKSERLCKTGWRVVLFLEDEIEKSAGHMIAALSRKLRRVG
jgi:hypothetical protein